MKRSLPYISYGLYHVSLADRFDTASDRRRFCDPLLWKTGRSEGLAALSFYFSAVIFKLEVSDWAVVVGTMDRKSSNPSSMTSTICPSGSCSISSSISSKGARIQIIKLLSSLDVSLAKDLPVEEILNSIRETWGKKMACVWTRKKETLKTLGDDDFERECDKSGCHAAHEVILYGDFLRHLSNSHHRNWAVVPPGPE